MEAFILREYDEWLADHMEELVNRYPSKVVAVHAGQVVHTGDSEAEVYQWIGKTDLTPMPLVFRIPRAADLDSVLYGHHYRICMLSSICATMSHDRHKEGALWNSTPMLQTADTL